MSKSKVFIFGGGFMGAAILAGINKNVGSSSQPFEAVLVTDRIFTTHDAERALQKAREEHGEPFAIFNAIGKKGVPNVDWCEDNKEDTFFSNVEIPLLLAELAWKQNLSYIHISTGCIFNGQGPFREDSVPNFDKSFYSYTKVQAEQRLLRLVHEFPEAYLEMHRIRMPFTSTNESGNLITKLISYPTIVEAPNSMTYVPDYVEMVTARMFNIYWKKEPGFRIINATNPGAMTHREVVEIIGSISGIEQYKKYITPEQLDKLTKVPRTNCVLEASEGGIYRPLDQAFMEAIRNYFKK